MSLTSFYSLERNAGLPFDLTEPKSLSVRPFAKDMATLWPEAEQSPLAQRWKCLAGETCEQIFARDLLKFAFSLEEQGETAVALRVFNYLTEKGNFPQAIRHQAQTQLNLWQGQGSLSERAGHWLRFLPMEISRGETAAALLLGAGGFNFGLRLGQRFFAGAGIIQKGLGASAMGLLGEASAMSLGYGAVQTYHGEKAEFGRLWMHSLAMSGAYRGMGFLLGRLAHLPLPAPLSQAWRQSSPLLRQEAGKFTGILCVEALMQGAPLNLGGVSSSEDVLFNSVTTYFNLALHHGLFTSVAPSWGRAAAPELSLAQFQFRLPKLPRARQAFSIQPRGQLAFGTAGASSGAARLPSENFGILKSVQVKEAKGPVLSLAKNGSGKPGGLAEATRRLKAHLKSLGDKPKTKEEIKPETAPAKAGGTEKTIVGIERLIHQLRSGDEDLIKSLKSNETTTLRVRRSEKVLRLEQQIVTIISTLNLRVGIPCIREGKTITLEIVDGRGEPVQNITLRKEPNKARFIRQGLGQLGTRKWT